MDAPRNAFASLVEMAQVRAHEAPDRLLYTYLINGEEPGPTLTHEQCYRQACAIAAALRERGNAGDRVLMLYPPGIEFPPAFFGCLFAGMIPVPATPPDPTRLARSLPRLLAIVKDAEASHALTTEWLWNLAKPMIEAQPELNAMQGLASDAAARATDVSWQPVQVTGDAPAFLQYTSGSTAEPKGVMVSHANILANLAAISQGCPSTPGERLVIWTPQFHDMGLILGVVWPVYSRAESYLMSFLDFLRRPLCWLQAISRFKAAYSTGPNFAYDLCLRKVTDAVVAQLDLRSWVTTISGAEPIQWKTLQTFARVFAPCGFRMETFSPAYGLAEAVLGVTYVPTSEAPVCLRLKADALERNRIAAAQDDDPNAREIVGCGRVWHDTEVRIVRPEACEPCDPDEVGEIWVRGSTVTAGYWRNAEATAAVFDGRLAGSGEGPFLRTGDLGFMKDGQIFVTGRIKDLILIRGANHYPQDIEATSAQSHSALRPGCVCAFTVTVDQEERLVVVQEVRDAFLAEVERFPEVVTAIRRAVADAHELQAYAVVLIRPRTLPKTSSGKLQRSATRAAFLEGALEAVAQEVARQDRLAPLDEESVAERFRAMPPVRRLGALESYVRKGIARALGIAEDEIAAGTPFLDLGLDSMKAMELIGDIEQELRVTIEPKEFFDHATVSALASWLNAQLDAPATRADDRFSEEVEEGTL